MEQNLTVSDINNITMPEEDNDVDNVKFLAKTYIAYKIGSLR